MLAADQITLDRIKLVHPDLRDGLLTDYMYVNNKLLPKGVRLRFVETYRSFDEQNKLFKKKPKVTNAKGGQSYHNYGLAFDIVILFDKNGDGTFETVSWDVDKYWMKAVDYFKSKGWKWGGDFPGSFKDEPHLEKTDGYNWRALLKLYNAGKFIPGTQYVRTDKTLKLASKRPIKLIKDFVHRPIDE